MISLLPSRYKLSRFISTHACIFVVACSTSFSQQGLTLSTSGKTDYVIVVAEDAIPAEKTAAEQLRKYLNEITGADFVIKSEKGLSANQPQILVGSGPKVKEMLPKVDWKGLGEDGVVIRTEGKNLILAGGRPRGTLYAVFEFLEKATGARWWTPTERTIPKLATLKIAPQDEVYRPPFDYRSHFTTAAIEDPEFATILRENGTYQKQDEAWGGHHEIIGFVHTSFYLLPPADYAKDHPEWYSDAANGNKPGTSNSAIPSAHSSQLCFSNPEVAEEMGKQALKWIEANPTAGYISITENDNGNYCTCEKCTELLEREGSQSGPIVQFVNQVAAKVKEKYPDFLVETLAYRGGIHAPKTVRPADNVLIRFAPLMADFGHPINSDWNGERPPGSAEGSVQENARGNLKAWADISKQIFVWNYITNFKYAMLPYPNWDGLGEDLRFFSENRVTGLFEQGDNYTNGVGDFVQLRAWLISKLMWNPKLDQKALMQEFLTGYYGAAGPYLEKYLALVQKSFRDLNIKLWADESDYIFMNIEVMNETAALFDKALAAVAGDPVLTDRVKRERISSDLIWLYSYRILRQTAAAKGLPFAGPADPLKSLDQVQAEADRFGVKLYQENNVGTGAFSYEADRLRKKNAPATPLPDEIAALVKKGSELTDIIELRPYDFVLKKEGTWSTVEEDATASTGHAVRIPGKVGEWGTQFQLPLYGQSFLKDDDWKVYIVARVHMDGEANESAAVEAGIYNAAQAATKGTGNVVHKRIPLNELADGKYHLIEIGTAPIPEKSYLWVASSVNASVTDVFIDRVILVRMK